MVAEIVFFLAAILDFSFFFAFPPVSSNGTFFGKTGISQDNIAVKIISVRILSRSTSRSTSLYGYGGHIVLPTYLSGCQAP